MKSDRETIQTIEDRIPYQKPQPWGMKPDLVVKDALNGDPKLWAPLSEGITSRPIMLNVSAGYYVHLMRVTRAGLLQRHRHRCCRGRR